MTCYGRCESVSQRLGKSGVLWYKNCSPTKKTDASSSTSRHWPSTAAACILGCSPREATHRRRDAGQRGSMSLGLAAARAIVQRLWRCLGSLGDCSQEPTTHPSERPCGRIPDFWYLGSIPAGTGVMC